jgi:hypothetical protein
MKFTSSPLREELGREAEEGLFEMGVHTLRVEMEGRAFVIGWLCSIGGSLGRLLYGNGSLGVSGGIIALLEEEFDFEPEFKIKERVMSARLAREERCYHR